MTANIARSALWGMLASFLLLTAYFTLLILVSDRDAALDQFSAFRYFIISLATGFGIQVGLYTYLKNLIEGGQGSGRVLGVTGTTSTVTMISCCSHYIVNVLPILGVTGLVTFVAQYQTELFWIGILFNLGGIAYMVRRILSVKHQ